MSKTWISYQRATRLTRNWPLVKNKGRLLPVKYKGKWCHLGHIPGMGWYVQLLTPAQQIW